MNHNLKYERTFNIHHNNNSAKNIILEKFNDSK
jgi:hypothetical protein